MTAGTLPLLTGTSLLAVSASGGPTAVAVLALLLMALAAVLGVLVAHRAYRGYRGSGDRGMLYLAAGIVLLAAGPTLLRFLVPTFTGVPTATLETATTVSELLGLAAILYSIYGNP